MERVVLAVVLLAPVVFNAVALLPELAIRVPSVNDDRLHWLFVQRASEALAAGQNVFDHWLPQIELGFPQFLYFQHIPHLAVVLLERLSVGTLDLFTAFNLVRYLLLVSFPLTVFWSMRRMGFSTVAAAMGGAGASLLSNDFRFGFEYDSYTWRGWGMYTQLWAMHLSFIALAGLYRVIHTGRGIAWAALALAALALSHLIYAYMMAVTVIVLVLFGLNRTNAMSRLVRVGTVAVSAGLIASYMVVPFALEREYLNASPYLEPERYDGYGIVATLRWLLAGDLLDHGRLPVLSGLFGLGLVGALLGRVRVALVAVALLIVWLILYAGRPALGPLADLLPFSEVLQFHRFIGAVHLASILLIGVGGAVLWQLFSPGRARWSAAAAGLAVLLLLVPTVAERAEFHDQNRLWMQRSSTALEADDDARTVIAALKRLPPGRVYAGLRTGWADLLRFEDVHFHDLLTFEGIEGLAPASESVSLNADLIREFDDTDLDHYQLFNVRYVVAPASLPMPDFLRVATRTARYTLYEAPSGGYATYGAIVARRAMGSQAELFASNLDWFRGQALPASQQFIRYDYPARTPGALPSGEACPEGEVLFELFQRGRMDFLVDCPRASTLIIKTTYHPNWRISVDGSPASAYMVSPSLIGVDLVAGRHSVTADYRPSPTKLPLLLVGFAALLIVLILGPRLDVVAARIVLRLPQPRPRRRSRVTWRPGRSPLPPVLPESNATGQESETRPAPEARPAPEIRPSPLVPAPEPESPVPPASEVDVPLLEATLADAAAVERPHVTVASVVAAPGQVSGAPETARDEILVRGEAGPAAPGALERLLGRIRRPPAGPFGAAGPSDQRMALPPEAAIPSRSAGASAAASSRTMAAPGPASVRAAGGRLRPGLIGFRRAVAVARPPIAARLTGAVADAGAARPILVAALSSIALYAIVYTAQRALHLGGSEASPEPGSPGQVAGSLRTYYLATAALFIVYAGVVIRVWRHRAMGGLARTLLLGTPILVQVGLMIDRPYLSMDVLSYLAHGSVGSTGGTGNAYTELTSGILGTSLGDQLTALGWRPPPILSSYGPLWTDLERLVMAVTTRVPVAILVFKLIATLASLGSIVLVWKILGHVRPADRLLGTVIYAWNPVVMVELSGEGHNDALMLLFALAGLLATVRLKPAATLVATTLGILTRYVPVILLPPQLVFLWHRRTDRGSFLRLVALGSVASLGLAAVLFAPVWAGYGTFDGLRMSGDPGPWPTISGAAFRFLQRERPDLDAGLIVLLLVQGPFVALAVLASVRVRSARGMLDAAATIAVAYLLLGSPVYSPWHAVLPVAMLALSPRLGTAVLIATISLMSRTVAPLVELRPEYQPIPLAVFQWTNAGILLGLGVFMVLLLWGFLGWASRDDTSLRPPDVSERDWFLQRLDRRIGLPARLRRRLGMPGPVVVTAAAPMIELLTPEEVAARTAPPDRHPREHVAMRERSPDEAPAESIEAATSAAAQAGAADRPAESLPHRASDRAPAVTTGGPAPTAPEAAAVPPVTRRTPAVPSGDRPATSPSRPPTAPSRPTTPSETAMSTRMPRPPAEAARPPAVQPRPRPASGPSAPRPAEPSAQRPSEPRRESAADSGPVAPGDRRAAGPTPASRKGGKAGTTPPTGTSGKDGGEPTPPPKDGERPIRRRR